jgi:pimeloyl-ACP methyl ester carboxylesterase
MIGGLVTSGRRALLGALAMICIPALVAGQGSITLADLDRYDAQKTRVTLANGQSLGLIDLGPRDAAPVVLIHGYTDSSRDWAPLAPLLSSKFRLLIVDLRGHGIAAKPECCYTRFDFAYDLKLLLDQLNIRAAHIVGHSLGSLVAQTFAESWPSATRHLILIASTGTYFGTAEAPTDWLEPLAQLEDPIDPGSAFMREWWQESTRINPEFFVSRQRRDAAAIPANVWRAIADQSFTGVDLAFMLPRIKAPTLLIWGDKDSLVTTAGRDALRNGIARSQSRTFASLGHDLFWENPQAVAAVMVDFLTKTEVKP